MDAAEGQGSQNGTRKLGSEVESSQVRRQEKAQNSNLWKQDEREGSSYSTKKKEILYGQRLPSAESQNMKYRNHQYITKIFHVLEVVNYRRKLNMFNGSTKDKCADMDVFVNESTRSTWTKLFGEFGSLQEHELRGNSLHIQNHTEIDF